MTDPGPAQSNNAPEGTGMAAPAPPAAAVEAPTETARRTAFQRIELVVGSVILLMLLIIVGLAVAITWLRFDQMNANNAFKRDLASRIEPIRETPPEFETPAEGSDLERAELVLDQAEATLLEARVTLSEAQQLYYSAEDSQNEVGLLLSFLEGATVLVGIAIGAAAYFGFRNTSEMREEYDRDHKRVQDALDTIRTLEIEVSGLQTLRHDLISLQSDLGDRPEQLRTQLREMRTYQLGIDTALQDMRQLQAESSEIYTRLVQAYQELSLKNYDQAYAAATHILGLDPDNIQALYIAGWLENQYIPGKRDDALARLEKAVTLNPEWPTARAVLGIIQRRRAVRVTGEEQNLLRQEAERNLSIALAHNPRLIDPNLESFWGPLAGMFRETERFEEAIAAYERACAITPGSSYPAGNLAALYLYKGRSDPAYFVRAQQKFTDTLKLAITERAQLPNDYFILMDIAMASMVLSHFDPTQYDFAEGRRVFDEALATSPTQEMLSVTQRGLSNLVDYLSDEPTWRTLKQRLQQALADVENL